MVKKILIKCEYYDICNHSANTEKCACCENNGYRNYHPNFFKPASDLFIPYAVDNNSLRPPVCVDLEDGEKNYLECPCCEHKNYKLRKTVYGDYICSGCGLIFNLNPVALADFRDEDPYEAGVSGV